MQTLAQPSYKDIQNKVKLHLATAVERGKISTEELLAILFILGQTTTVSELETFIDIFADSFAVLTSVHLEKRQTQKVDLEEKVKKIVSKMVFVNPLRATELTKDALKKDMTWENLVKKYPELEDEK